MDPLTQIEHWTRGPKGFVGKANRQLTQIERGLNRAPRPPFQVFRDEPEANANRFARVTAIHENYIEAKFLSVNASTAEWSVPETATVIYVAKHPSLMRQFYDGKTVTDPVTADDATYAYDDVQERTVTVDGDDEEQRVVPWYTTDDDASPIIVGRGYFPVKGDSETGVVICRYVDLGPAYWAKKAT